MFKKTLLSASIAALLVGMSASSQACFTVVVGKDASATGQVLLGHNEDNDLRIITNQYWVPAADHKKGEMLKFEDKAASIPQIEHTLGFWWTQTLAPGGYSFSDGFFNEKGVAIASNNCNFTIEENQKVIDGGIGYGIRRIVAERATSARHGVDIVVELIEKYGYFHMGRTYTIADKNEAWQIALLRGHRYLARRVADNEIAFIANAFSLDNIDLNDKKNIIASPDLIEHAIEMGTYKPKVAGDYSDFSFREAYQPEARRVFPRNKERVFTILELLTGKEYKDVNDYPTALVPEKKITLDDMKRFLRGNSKFEKRESGWHHETMQDISNIGTFDSVIYELDQNPNLTTAWRASGRPDQQLFVPCFPMGRPAAQQSYMDPETGLHAQFHATPEQLSYSADRPIYTFLAQQFFLDWMPEEYKSFMKDRDDYEEDAVEILAKAKIEAAGLYAVNPLKAIDYMHAFNVDMYRDALSRATNLVRDLNRYQIVIGADNLSKSSNGTVDVTLMGKKGFDVTKIDVKKTYFGSPYPDDKIELNKKRAQPVKVVFKDVNKDGHKDAVMTFGLSGATAFGHDNVLSELYLYTYVDGEPVVAFDTATIIK